MIPSVHEVMMEYLRGQAGAPVVPEKPVFKAPKTRHVRDPRMVAAMMSALRDKKKPNSDLRKDKDNIQYVKLATEPSAS